MKETQTGTLIHFGELSLKGKNRNVFIDKLINNIEIKTGGKVTKYRDRLFLTGGEPEALTFVYGISWYSKAVRLKKDLNIIQNNLKDLIDNNLHNNKTFGIHVKRADKSFKPDSQGLASYLGKIIIEKI